MTYQEPREGAPVGAVVEIPPADDDRRLRHVRLAGTPYTLIVWDTYRTEPGRFPREILGYALAKDGEADPIFCAEDYFAPAIKSRGRSIDGDHTLRDLLGFLTLRPGDTDEEYFASYTPRQIAFAADEAEALSIWALEVCDGDTPLPALESLDGWEPSDAS